MDTARPSTPRPAPQTPTADAVDQWLRWPTAVAAEAWLRARQRRRGRSPGVAAGTPRLTGPQARALADAPRVRTTAAGQLPAYIRWQLAVIAIQRRQGRMLPRAGGRPVATPGAPRAAVLAIAIQAPGAAADWRATYHLAVVDGEVLLYPRRVPAGPFLFRPYAGRAPSPPPPGDAATLAIDRGLTALVAALQARCDATDD
ncbi:MAG TPA: hypothetical protein VFW96_01960 [Thermomicrobiales bacterium]|nr:hypothetical protein [Thermomicrobiales bacterium]